MEAAAEDDLMLFVKIVLRVLDDELDAFSEKRYLCEIDRASFKEVCNFYDNIREEIIDKFHELVSFNKELNLNDNDNQTQQSGDEVK